MKSFLLLSSTTCVADCVTILTKIWLPLCKTEIEKCEIICKMEKISVVPLLTSLWQHFYNFLFNSKKKPHHEKKDHINVAQNSGNIFLKLRYFWPNWRLPTNPRWYLSPWIAHQKNCIPFSNHHHPHTDMKWINNRYFHTYFDEEHQPKVVF